MRRRIRLRVIESRRITSGRGYYDSDSNEYTGKENRKHNRKGNGIMKIKVILIL